MAKKSSGLSKVGSSNVADFAYDRKTQTLGVQFIRRKGRRKFAEYIYHDVPPEEVRGLRRARSKGRYMNSIAYDYEYDRVR